MLLSTNWLKTFISEDIPVHDIAYKLTMAGLEVEEILSKGDRWENIFVGEIFDIKPHPNADKLSIVKVSMPEQLFSVVCGADNINTGQKIPLALPGAVVAGGFQIKKSKIRGETSEGMICSEPELELGDDSSGIMVLPQNAVPGTIISNALNLSDTILNINVTPNRPDCLSVLGIAREIAALFNVNIAMPDHKLLEGHRSVKDEVSVDIVEPGLCPRYCARIIDNIRIEQSPLWMRKRLEYCGIRPINNIVDITNFVLLEFGQPLHAFDFEKLTDRKIVVRTPNQGETLKTLDEVERTLPEDVLLICSSSEPVAIAGIMGGEESGITAKTNKILIESAYFSPRSIATSSRKLKLKTEASIRFEKGIDINAVIPSLNRASALISEITGVKPYKDIIDNYPNPSSSQKPVKVPVEKVNSVTGLSLTTDKVKKTLEKLNFKIIEKQSDIFNVTAPSYRQDISIFEDIVEEVARIEGYENIPTTYPEVSLCFRANNMELKFASCLRSYFISQGFNETVNFSFYSPDMISIMKLPENDDRYRFVKILNPLSSSQSVLRTSIIPSLLVNLKDNMQLRNKTFKLFEIANVFYSKGTDSQPLEIKKIAGIMAGLKSEESWNKPGCPVGFFDIKGCLENLFSNINISYTFSKSPVQPFLYPNKSLNILTNNKTTGFLGQIHPDIVEKHDIETDIFVFELDFINLFKHYSNKIEYRPFSRTPSVQRDIALVVDDDIDAATVFNTIKSFKNDLVTDVSFFDYYKGPNIDEHKKSLAYRLIFQSDDRTLTDSEVNSVMDKLIVYLQKKLKAELRQ